MMSRRMLLALAIIAMASDAGAWDRVVVTDEEFMRIIGRKPDRKNPHATSEYRLMTEGSKRLAYISDPDMVEQFRRNGEFVVDPFRGETYLIYRNRDAELAAVWRDTYRQFEAGHMSRREADERCGQLLGYTNWQIQAFLGRSDGMR